MKFYSELTKKLYETEKALSEAEKAEKDKVAKEKAEAEKTASEKEARAEEIKKAYNEMLDADEKYETLVDKYCEDYDIADFDINFDDNGNIQCSKSEVKIPLDDFFDVYEATRDFIRNLRFLV